MKEDRKASMVLGILSICLSWLSWPATILAIIGLSIKKSDENRGRDITLNVIGLIASILFLILYLALSGDAASSFSEGYQAGYNAWG